MHFRTVVFIPETKRNSKIEFLNYYSTLLYNMPLGDALSPLLFNLDLEYSIRKTRWN
jgi:hypothetical protein